MDSAVKRGDFRRPPSEEKAYGTGAVVGDEVPDIESVGGAGVGDAALHEINGIWFTLDVDQSGFIQNGVNLWYTTGNCSGTGYLLSWPNWPNGLTYHAHGVYGGVANNILYYPDPTAIQARLLLSFQQMFADGTLSKCVSSTTGVPQPSAPFLAFDLSQLGLVPPFSIRE